MGDGSEGSESIVEEVQSAVGNKPDAKQKCQTRAESEIESDEEPRDHESSGPARFPRSEAVSSVDADGLSMDPRNPFWENSFLTNNIDQSVIKNQDGSIGAVSTFPHDSPSKYTATTLVESSHRGTPARGRTITPEATAGRFPNMSCWILVTQSDIDFATESIQQVRDFNASSNSLDTYKHIIISLQEKKDHHEYSVGSEWVNLVDSGDNDRQRSSVLYALAAIAFCRWHANQTQHEVQSTQLTLKVAKAKVSARLLSESAPNSTRERLRKRLNVHLTRGRKWSQLVDELGLGILFRHTWDLGKASEVSLQPLILSLKESSVKMMILGHLETQLKDFISRGQTNPDMLERALAKQNLLDDLLQPLGIPVEDLIQICLNLAEKLPAMRVGFPVVIHDRHEGKPLAEPFRWASKRIERWNSAKAGDRLVCFFPLFLENNHFTLLEINQMDQSIYHYDSAKYSSGHIKEACKIQFPNLRYADQVQSVGYSDNGNPDEEHIENTGRENKKRGRVTTDVLSEESKHNITNAVTTIVMKYQACWLRELPLKMTVRSAVGIGERVKETLPPGVPLVGAKPSREPMVPTVPTVPIVLLVPAVQIVPL
ncbi:hypothetical protein SCUP234_03539 [Seiridium cupressi]